MKTEQARQILKDAGFFVDDLWSVYDVTDRYECTAEEAMRVLYHAISNDFVSEAINIAIQDICEMNEYEPKDED